MATDRLVNGSWVSRQTDGRLDIQTKRWIDKQTGTHKHIRQAPTDRQMHRLTDRQTDTYMYLSDRRTDGLIVEWKTDRHVNVYESSMSEMNLDRSIESYFQKH